MTQLSREKLEEIKYRAETQGINAGYLPGEILSMVDRLLAAEAHEPVATLDVQSGRPDGNKFALVYSLAAHKLPDDVYYLYAAPQPVAVPDVSDLEKVLRFIEGLPVPTNGAAKNGKRLYDFIVACRAAMLNNEPVSQPYKLVGEVVAWNHATEERRVDFRWIDFDVMSGTKLYAMPPETPQEPAK